MPFTDQMHIEQLKDAQTPEEMRAEIHRLSRERSSVIVRSVMDCADFNGLSSEDRYTMLAYHALRDLAHCQKLAHELIAVTPRPHFIAATPTSSAQDLLDATGKP